MIDKNDPKQVAEAYEITAEYLMRIGFDGVANHLHVQADKLDPPYKLDRSLRGLVRVTTEHRVVQRILWAEADGLWKTWHPDKNRGHLYWCSWDTAERTRYRIEKLHVSVSGEVPVEISALRRCLDLAEQGYTSSHPEDLDKLCHIAKRLREGLKGYVEPREAGDKTNLLKEA